MWYTYSSERKYKERRYKAMKNKEEKPSLIEQVISPEFVPIEEQLTIIDDIDGNIYKLYELDELFAKRKKEKKQNG